MKRRLSRFLRSRDHIWTVLSLVGFGIYSFLDPTPSLAALPWIIEKSLNGLFILSGLTLSAGYWCKSFETFVFGHILAIASCCTVAGVIVFSSASPISVLVFGFATALSASLQKVFLERRELRLAGL